MIILRNDRMYFYYGIEKKNAPLIYQFFRIINYYEDFGSWEISYDDDSKHDGIYL